MKAARFHEHGGADVLCYEDAPDLNRCPAAPSFASAFPSRTFPAVTSPVRSWTAAA